MRRSVIIFSVILIVLIGTASSVEGVLTSTQNEQATDYYDEGVKLHNENKYEEAITYYDKALEINPDLRGAYYYRGRAYHMSGEYSKAVSDYSKAIELKPDHTGYYFVRGMSYRELEDYPNAISDYSKYLEKNPDSVSAYMDRAEFYFKLEDYTNSITDYSKLIELNPNSANAYYKRALSYEKLNEPEKAQSDYVKASSLNSKYEKYVTKTTPTITTQEHTTTASSGEGEEISEKSDAELEGSELPTTSPPKTVTTQTKDISGDSGFSLNPFKLIKSFFEKIFFRLKSEFDFDIDVDPAIATIKQGGTAEAYVKVTPVKGDRETVDLTITNWNSKGVTSYFDTTSTKTGSNLYISASCDTPPDSYLHTVQGESGTRTSVDSINVIVEENKEDCTEPTTAKSTPTGSEEPVTLSAKAVCTTDRITEYNSDGIPISGDFTVEFSGSASGPVSSYIGSLIDIVDRYSGELIIDCGAWGSNCKRDAGEPSVTYWSQKEKKINSGPFSTSFGFWICGTHCGNMARTEQVTASCRANAPVTSSIDTSTPDPLEGEWTLHYLYEGSQDLVGTYKLRSITFKEEGTINFTVKKLDHYDYLSTPEHWVYSAYGKGTGVAQLTSRVVYDDPRVEYARDDWDCPDTLSSTKEFDLEIDEYANNDHLGYINIGGIQHDFFDQEIENTHDCIYLERGEHFEVNVDIRPFRCHSDAGSLIKLEDGAVFEGVWPEWSNANKDNCRITINKVK